MTISPNRRSTKRGRPLVTDGRSAAADVNGWPTSAERPGPARTTVLQLLLHSDAHSRGLPAVRPRRRASRPCHRRRSAADLFVVRRDSRGLHLSTLRDRRRFLPARNLCPLRPSRGPDRVDDRRRARPQAMAAIVEALCRVDRPASILTWKRSPRVQELLTGLAIRGDPADPSGPRRSRYG